MSDINLPTSVVNVQWQEEKPAQDGEKQYREPPADKVAESYEEGSRTITDKITILGIPADLMTTQVQSTIAGLVAEVDHLKAKVRRYEHAMQTDAADGDLAVLHGEVFVNALDKAIGVPPPAGYFREFVLVVVNTFEDIRSSSGLLSANSTLLDIVARLGGSDLGAAPIGLAGGPVIAALLTRPEAEVSPAGEPTHEIVSTADLVRRLLDGTAYSVAGLDMNLRFTVASVRVETGQSALHVIGQADHILRS